MGNHPFLAISILLVSGLFMSAGPAGASTVFDFSYKALDGSFSGEGEFIAAGKSPTFQVIDVKGTALNGSVGSKIDGISTFASADNLLTFPKQPYTDFFGISFHTVSDGDFNIYFNNVEFFGYGVIRQSIDPTGMGPGTAVALTIAATPVPDTLSLLLSSLVAMFSLARLGGRRIIGV
ncbi:MAG TPA: hypothetical protein VKW08_06445 [Xanthobacteraceae bacterium]|jgi:hypothetical protein|nr:hypothetical protein [Xanthobacteraceae bacterium]